MLQGDSNLTQSEVKVKPPGPVYYNKVNGQSFIDVRSPREKNFKRQVQKIVQYRRLNCQKWYVQHLTLTFKDASAYGDARALNRYLSWLRPAMRKNNPFFVYVDTKEIQMQRLRRLGESALHYHFLLVYDKPYTVPSHAELSAHWRLGHVFVSVPRLKFSQSDIFRYMSKYLGKGDDMITALHARSWSGSQIMSVYSLSEVHVDECVSRYGKHNFGCLRVRYRKVYLYGKNVETGKDELILLHSFPSDWVRLRNEIEDEPASLPP
jgi:hypothetical protein